MQSTVGIDSWVLAGLVAVVVSVASVAAYSRHVALEVVANEPGFFTAAAVLRESLVIGAAAVVAGANVVDAVNLTTAVG
jgi:hypothetical protein